jgi:hypothetical protein
MAFIVMVLVVFLKGLDARAVSVPLAVKLALTSRVRCHLPRANYMKMHLAVDSNPTLGAILSTVY